MAKDERELREEKDGITRRDFVDGALVGAAGIAAASAIPSYVTGTSTAKAASPKGIRPGYYPPAFRDPLVGQRDKVINRAMKIDGEPVKKAADVHSTKGGPGIHPNRETATGEEYDCVIVGGGASGIAAAKFYQDKYGSDKKILILEQLPDFGGHSKRNEFHTPNAANGNADVMALRNGGAVNLDSIGTWNKPGPASTGIPGSYGQPAVDFLSWAGVDTATATKWQNGGAAGIPSSYGLYARNYWPSAEFGGVDHCDANRNVGPFANLEPNTLAGWTAWLDRTPYSAAAKAGILRVQFTNEDFLANAPGAPLTQDQKRAYLTTITYKQYMLNHVGINEEAFNGEYWRGSGSLLGAGGQAVSAADCWALGRPGFPSNVGLGSTTNLDFPGLGRTPYMDARSDATPTRAWPDGNTSLLRLAVSKLIPNAFPDVNVGDGPQRPDQLSILKSNCLYEELDNPSNNVRIRINATVYSVGTNGSGGSSPVKYVYNPVPRNLLQAGGGPRPIYPGGGQVVSAKHIIMACWNRVTSHIVQGLPEEQKEGLCYARKVPLIYGRVALKNWQAFADSKVSSIAPKGASPFYSTISLSAGAGFGPTATPGKYYGPTPNQPPTAPAQLTFTAIPNDPNAEPQVYAYSTGQQILRSMSWADMEDEVIRLIDLSVNQEGGDFDPARDIDSWAINRWMYGYAHELSSNYDPSMYGAIETQPHYAGRQPFRNVAIANSDSEGFAYTHSAISEAYRAVNDLT